MATRGSSKRGSSKRRFFLAAAGAFAVLAPEVAAAQSVNIVRRDSMGNADSISMRLTRTADLEELMLMATRLREREAQLVNALRLVPPGGSEAERRLFNELGDVARQQFALISLADARCHGQSGPQPEGYIGVNLTSKVDSVSGTVQHTIIESVEPGSPAQRAGLTSGDTLYSIGGRDVRRRLPDATGLLRPGNRVAVRIGRAQGPREVIVTVAPRPKTFTKACGEFERFLTPLRVTAWRSTRDGALTTEPAGSQALQHEVRFDLFGPDHIAATANPFFAGAQFRELDADWRRVLGVPDGQDGVLVNMVSSGSAAAQSGLRNGDVVTAVGDTPAHSPLALVQMLSLAERAGRPEAVLRVLRAKEPKTVTLRWVAAPR
ncbi:MAG TPA: PDZ domain-containing protein [Gemmatimonadaceae bacterium]|nr:PDZ domain-containing protein [Gemmatimonadaceae bacterium]